MRQIGAFPTMATFTRSDTCSTVPLELFRGSVRNKLRSPSAAHGRRLSIHFCAGRLAPEVQWPPQQRGVGDDRA